MLRMRKWVIIAAAIALVISAGFEHFTLPDEEAPKAGYLAPSFELEGADGKTYAVGGKRGKALLINFWASWCYPCKLEAPDLVRFHEEYEDDLDIYAVNAFTTDTRNGMLDFIDEYGIEFPVLVDKEGDVMKLYRVLGFPTNILVDRNGVVKKVFMGYHPPEELEREIKRAVR